MLMCGRLHLHGAGHCCLLVSRMQYPSVRASYTSVALTLTLMPRVSGVGMNVDEVVMKAFESLSEEGEGTGLSVVDIARWCSQQMGREIPRTAVMKVVDKMCLEGMTYSTIDEEHYAKI
jgi:hypothetical protein